MKRTFMLASFLIGGLFLSQMTFGHWAPPLDTSKIASNAVCSSPLEKSTPCKFREGLVQKLAWKVAMLISASNDLGGQIWPRPFPHFGGVQQLLFYNKKIDMRPHGQNSHFSVWGIKCTLLGTPYNPYDPLKNRTPCKIWEGSVQRCGHVSRTHTHTHSILVYT